VAAGEQQVPHRRFAPVRNDKDLRWGRAQGLRLKNGSARDDAAARDDCRNE
jgi:hypothetical protein